MYAKEKQMQNSKVSQHIGKDFPIHLFVYTFIQVEIKFLQRKSLSGFFIRIILIAVIYKARHLTFLFQLKLISWMVTFSSCLIWQIISFILSLNEYSCVYDSLSGPAINLQKMPILAKNHFFRWSSFWSWRACKQAKLSHLGHRKPAYIENLTH